MRKLLPLIIIMIGVVFLIIIIPSNYDINQSYVLLYDSRNKFELYSLTENKFKQSFEAEADALVGFDVTLNGRPETYMWILSDSEGKELRSGSEISSGYVRNSKIRFEKISISNGENISIEVFSEGISELEIPVSESDLCGICNLEINGEYVSGNTNIVPVYLAGNRIDTMKILKSRITKNLNLYFDNESDL